ncbi:hypothetical protein EGM70_04835 [Enterobacteriaceae bacterium 89]|nr:hypothetical protein [Enterobacteriaceae bacterium 89]
MYIQALCLGVEMDELPLPTTGFALVRCTDRAIVTYFETFPECDRALMYRKGNVCSFMPLADDEIVARPSLMVELMRRAGYRVIPTSDIML